MTMTKLISSGQMPSAVWGKVGPTDSLGILKRVIPRTGPGLPLCSSGLLIQPMSETPGINTMKAEASWHGSRNQTKECAQEANASRAPPPVSIQI